MIGHHTAPPKDEEVESGEMLQTDRRDMSHPHEYGMTWYHREVWVLHDMISGAALLVSETINFFIKVNITSVNVNLPR